jgi:chemosensory pili system protein ChpA (sensor histidine kinase/response regulator)
MGNLSHHLESVLTRIVEGIAQSNTKLQEIIQNSVDELAAMLEAVRSGVPLDMPEDLIEQINSALGAEEQQGTEEIPVIAPKSTTSNEDEAKKAQNDLTNIDKQLIEKEAELTDNAEDRIRVRATLIDKLTNLAGELSITRAHMEQQQSTIKYHLEVMEETVTRLRDQLRRFEIETEAQIISHFSGSKEIDQNEEFDPLELDRFSTLQQLSRSLMESVNDLNSIQDYLKNQTRQSDSLLIQESRIGAELQENIMRTRMIPFARISPRLQRIARLTARELHKQVNFVINGENTEFERTVLDRIVAPHEHLLRNAIKHGIEDAPTRQQAGKSSIGKITIDLFREGTELIIKLSDDGSGLDLLAIRQKAEKVGFIKPDTVISDNELMQFILEPGFSTAKTIDQVAGRGVGMDVVSNEIKQLGGSLQIQSKTGKGTTFEIRLPLSLTINQALLVRVGDETMAVPMNHVDAVMRAESAEVLGEPSEVRHYQYMDKKYRIFHLGELLGFGKTASAEIPLIPMLLVRAGDRRVALLVDGIEGSKEIVVKSVGSQIGAIRWISGATILGDGRVVLILDMPVLCRADATQQSVPTQVVEVVKEEKLNAKTIMVVDDSITVRKVTSRLLKRQGMEVFMAKDGLDAVTQLQENIPDLMLLDVEMPRMDGYELATTVRNNPDWKHIPIIMITSRTGAKHRDKAEKIGINRYLGKPFNETELLENINALLA